MWCAAQRGEPPVPHGKAYLHSVAEVGAGSDSHHGQQARSRADVQDNDLLPTSPDPGHRRPDALVVLLILEGGSTSAVWLKLHDCLLQMLFELESRSAGLFHTVTLH